MEYSGIDVSEIQGKINWKSVMLRKIKFAMIRATYGTSGIDSQFEENIKNTSLAGIYAGAYHESSASNTLEAAAEANHFLKTIKPYKFCYPLAVKYENEIIMETGKKLTTEIILAFVNVVRVAKYYPILYGGVEWIKSYFDIAKAEDLDIWISDLSVQPKVYPSYDKNVTIWQHSNRGRMPGIVGNVNLDISYVDYPLILEQRGFNNLNNFNNDNNKSGAENRNKISLNSESYEPIFYTVQKGDTLRTIAKKFLGNPDEYRKIMEISGISRPVIYPGQTLRIPRTGDPGVILHRVKPGETLWELSEKYLEYGPRYNEIMALNGLTTDMIYAGQILKIPIEQRVAPEVYRVRTGDTLWKIAQNLLGDGNRYAEIISLNNLRNGNIRAGQLLNIPKK
ncbi:MAG: LysM peptidoglycan-binding domain-containing protein [Clostridia bacterium]|nr:LysM peptidoglycan-binding domain-containing protein [Clostridia bacterium]